MESLNRFRSWGIVLVLYLLGFWASATKGGHDPPAIILFRRYDGRISRILEHEPEHELSISAFGLKRTLPELVLGEIGSFLSNTDS